MVFTVGTLTVAPGFPLGSNISRRALESTPGVGVSTRRQVRTAHSENTSAGPGVGEDETLGWELDYKHLTTTERDAIQLLWDNSASGVLPIEWTPPNYSASLPVQMIGDSLEFAQVTGNTYSTRILLGEFI